jgi:hypothetical protein
MKCKAQPRTSRILLHNTTSLNKNSSNHSRIISLNKKKQKTKGIIKIKNKKNTK